MNTAGFWLANWKRLETYFHLTCFLAKPRIPSLQVRTINSGGIMKNLLSALFGLFILVSWAAPAGAFTPGACKEDIDKYCKGVKVGENGLKACLHKHMAELSDACKANILDAFLKKKEAESK